MSANGTIYVGFISYICIYLFLLGYGTYVNIFIDNEKHFTCLIPNILKIEATTPSNKPIKTNPLLQPNIKPELPYKNNKSNS